MVCRHTQRFINVLIIIKTAKINVKNFHGSLTTVVRAQNDTSQQISLIPFSIEHTGIAFTSDGVLKIGEIRRSVSC